MRLGYERAMGSGGQNPPPPPGTPIPSRLGICENRFRREASARQGLEARSGSMGPLRMVDR